MPTASPLDGGVSKELLSPIEPRCRERREVHLATRMLVGGACGLAKVVSHRAQGGCVAQVFCQQNFINLFIVSTLMKKDVSQRFGFLVSDVAKLYGEQFDRMARERIGLSRAQCRVLGVLAVNGSEQPLSQTELAQRLGLSTMAVAGLCDRMVAAGWIRRQASTTDRRINEVHPEPRASEALDKALAIGDALNARAMATLTQAERTELLALLGKVRLGLIDLSQGTELVS